ncbi:MAG: hypothetical protein PHW35_13405 [Lentimicrobiaceae bacterium]|nr:hypothetical protein [Lentimicrobiaceae bacterium]
MKKSMIALLFLAFARIGLSSCKKDNDDNDNNNNKIPDAVFSMNVSGAESHTFNFTLPGNVASANAVSGSHQSSLNMLTMLATNLPITWQYSLVADVSSMAKGTYDLKPGLSAFSPPSQTTGYLAVSGSVEITKATLYQNVSNVEDWFIDGSFSGTYQDSNTPPNTITVSGSFSGVNIKAQ